jgi:hypothetical protein
LGAGWTKAWFLPAKYRAPKQLLFRFDTTCQFCKFYRLGQGNDPGYACAYMKKIIQTTKSNTPVVPEHRSFRRFVNKMFASFIKRQSSDVQKEFQATVLETLHDIGDSIEIITREIARQARRGQK